MFSSLALMRCCKDLGIAWELWDPRFIREFKKEHVIMVQGYHFELSLVPTLKLVKLNGFIAGKMETWHIRFVKQPENNTFNQSSSLSLPKNYFDNPRAEVKFGKSRFDISCLTFN
jgi:hypothetical protein